MSRIFITRHVPGDAPARLEAAGHEVDIWPEHTPPPHDVLVERLRDADAVMTMITDRVDAELLAASPRLRIAANMAVGYDNLDAEAAAEAGVWVTNTPGVLAETTADLAFALILAGARRLGAAERSVRAGEWVTWSPTDFTGLDVYGATLGIIGLGEIGEAVARRASGFSMRVLYHSRTRKPEVEETLGAEWCEQDDLLARADFVSLHTPLTPETRHMIGAVELSRMQSHAILVNTARGGIVDQDALVDALRTGAIGGAALDVMDPEPLPMDSPLLDLPNVTLLPHIGSASVATRSRMANIAGDNILAVLDGREPPNPRNRPQQPR